MADTRLSTSIESLRQKLKDQIPNANAEQLKRISRSARKLGYTQDTEIETLLNTRANTLIAATNDPTEVETIAAALNEMDDTINPTISTAGTLVGGASKIVTDDSAPGNPEDGDLWFKTDDLDLYVYYDDGDTSQWVQVNAASLGENALVTTSSSSPANPVVGQLWFDTNTNILYAYHNAQWVQTGSGFNPASVSESFIPDTNEAYDLGSAEKKFRDLYLSSNTIYLGETTFSSDDILNFDLSVTPEVLEIQVDDPTEGHGTAWQWTWEQSALPFARLSITNSPQTVVPLYLEGTYQINNFAHTIHGSMSQRHDFKLKWIEGAGDDNLVPWVTTSIVNDSHPDINGGTAQDVQRLDVIVPPTIVLPTLVAPSVSYDVTSVTGAYVFTGTIHGNNPEIGPFYRGGTYTVNINAAGHPFYFTTDNGTNFAAGQYFGEYTNGVTGSRTDVGTITFTVPADAPDILYYQCGNHSNMRGTIRVKDLAVETNANGNYIIYGQHDQEGHVQKIELRPLPTLTSQMCLVYDSSTNKFVPQDLATYVENTPSFENKIKEVAGTATLIAPDGTSLVASVNIYSDATYLPAVGNTVGDIAFVEDTQKLYIYKTTGWIETVANADLTGLATETYVQNYVANNVSGGNVVEYTATSSTSVNDVVMLNSDGTVSKIDVVSYNGIPKRGEADITTTNWTSAGQYRGYGAHFHDTSDKIAALYYSSSGLKSLIVSINGSSVTTGSTYSHAGDTSARIFADQHDSSKVIILNTNGTYLTYQTGSVLGTAITWDSVVTTPITLPHPCYIHYNHNDSTDGSMVFDVAYGGLKVKRFIWDGTNMSASNEIDLGTTGLSEFLRFDPSTSGRFATRQGGVLIGGLIDWTSETAVVGGTSPINGGNHTASSAGTHMLDFNPLTGDIVVAAQNLDGFGYKFTLQSFSMDNTYTITGLGSQTTLVAGSNVKVQFARDLKFIPNSQNFVLIHSLGDQYDQTYYKVYNVNGNGFTSQHSERLDQYSSLIFSTSVNHSRKGQYTVHGVRRQPDSTWKYFNEVIFGQTPYDESNLDASKVHGIATTSGTTIDVTVENGIHSGLSGLTAGSKYYVLENGTLSTTPDSKQAKIGLAMTSTSLAIDFTDELTSADLGTYATKSYVNAQVANLVDSAPATLDTLNELAAALGDDPNFATTITNSLANKLEASALNGYATQSYVNSNFATQSYVDSNSENKTIEVLSGASPQIDLTKNYFKIDLTSDTSFTTTGSTTSGDWYEGKIEIKGKADQLTHNLVTNPSGQISGWRSTSSTSTISGFYNQGYSLYGFFGVSPNGQYAITGSYVGTGDYKFQIIEFSTPNDITTGSLVYQSGNVHGTIGGLNQRPNAYFATDTKFVTSTGHVITMPTGNITTSNPYGTLPSHSGTNSRASRGNWTSDGTRYITVEEEQNQDPIFKLYTASTPFYANTLSLTQSYTFNRFSISGDHPLKIDHGNSVHISDDGLNLYTGGYYQLNNYSNQMVMHFTLSTAFNLSTMSYTSNSLTSGTVALNYGKFTENGNQYWAPQSNGIYAYQNLNTPAVLKTTTWPDTWSWEGGSSPTPIPNNETDIVNFVTTDGGSTFKASTKKYYN